MRHDSLLFLDIWWISGFVCIQLVPIFRVKELRDSSVCVSWAWNFPTRIKHCTYTAMWISHLTSTIDTVTLASGLSFITVSDSFWHWNHLEFRWNQLQSLVSILLARYYDKWFWISPNSFHSFKSSSSSDCLNPLLDIDFLTRMPWQLVLGRLHPPSFCDL